MGLRLLLAGVFPLNRQSKCHFSFSNLPSTRVKMKTLALGYNLGLIRDNCHWPYFILLCFPGLISFWKLFLWGGHASIGHIPHLTLMKIPPCNQGSLGIKFSTEVILFILNSFHVSIILWYYTCNTNNDHRNYLQGFLWLNFTI